MTVSLYSPPPAAAFTQLGGTSPKAFPMGHEWLTRRAAIEVLRSNPKHDPWRLKPDDPAVPYDGNDPRFSWRMAKEATGLAKNLEFGYNDTEAKRIMSMPHEDRYQSMYKLVFDAIIGERWVDFGGFNVLKSNFGSYDCFDAVAQQPTEVQFDHFMRRPSDGHGSASHVVSEAQARFKEYFVAAARAQPMQILVWDGGASPTRYSVDRNYFLFGRAVHMFQDSFSSEHTVRIAADNYRTIRQVKSYHCALDSEQHSHAQPTTSNYEHGDVIWKRGTSHELKNYIPSNMKPNALVALEATKDLWAAFIRTMGSLPQERASYARAEAEVLVQDWLKFDSSRIDDWYYSDSNHRDPTYVSDDEEIRGRTQKQCLAEDLNVGVPQADYVATFDNARKVCLYNLKPVAGYADLNDEQMHMPLNWDWTGLASSDWKQPPKDWQIPPPSKGVRVQLMNEMSYGEISGNVVTDTNLVANGKERKGIVFILLEGEPDPKNPAFRFAYFRTADDPTLFLSYRTSSDKATLRKGTDGSSFRLEDAGGLATAIWNTDKKAYLWVGDGSAVMLSKEGNPKNSHSRWSLPGRGY